MAGSGNRVVGGGGGARVVFDARMRRTFTESGLSSVSGLGHAPDGPGTYEAARRMKADHRGQYVMRIHGVFGPSQIDPDFDNWQYGAIGSEWWIGYRVYKQDVLDALDVLRRGGLAGGDGQSVQRHLPYDTDPRFNSTFLRIISELSHFRWDSVYTVQFL